MVHWFLVRIRESICLRTAVEQQNWFSPLRNVDHGGQTPVRATYLNIYYVVTIIHVFDFIPRYLVLSVNVRAHNRNFVVIFNRPEIELKFKDADDIKLQSRNTNFHCDKKIMFLLIFGIYLSKSLKIPKRKCLH